MIFFNRGPKKLRDHMNEQSKDLDSLLNYNLRGDGIIEVRHIGQGQTLRLNMSRLLQRLGVHSSGTGTPIRKAYAQAAAGAGSTIACFLDTDTTGDSITVTCEIVGGSALNAALPRLADGTMVSVWDDAGIWRSIMTFQASGPC